MQEASEVDRRGRHPFRAWLALLAVLVVLAGCCAWVAGIAHRGYDYDEVLRAHAIWLSAQGLRPYHDFMDYQPPFSRALAALVPVEGDPSVCLHLLRAFGALGNLLFLAGLVAIARARRVASLSGCILVTAVIAFHPRVLEFLVEFRMDGWGYAVLTWTIAWFLVSRSASRYFLLAFLTGLVDLFLCPKLAFLPLLLVGVELLARRGAFRERAVALGGYAAGSLAALLVLLAWLGVTGIDPRRMLEMVVKFNAIGNANSSLGYGLLREILAQPALAAGVVLGAAALAFDLARRRQQPPPYELALALTLVLQAVSVSYPYKQYYAPWFLFGSVFVPFLSRSPGLARSRRLATAIAVSLLALVSLAGSYRTLRAWSHSNEASHDAECIRFLRRLVGPDDFVIASFPCHPITRRDTFWAWFTPFDPQEFDVEKILDRLPALAHMVSPERFREELEQHPPAAVWLGEGGSGVMYSAHQREVVTAYLEQHEYLVVETDGGKVAVRPDRWQSLSGPSSHGRD